MDLKKERMPFGLRPWQSSDIDSLVKYANNKNIAKYLTNSFPHPYSVEDGKAFIEFVANEKLIHVFAIDVKGVAVGGIGIHPQTDIYQKNAELGYWLAEPFWGKGIISTAIKLMIDFAFETYDINRIFAKTFEGNIGSQNVLLKNNFVLEAKLNKVVFKNGKYLDECIFGFRRDLWNNTF